MSFIKRLTVAVLTDADGAFTGYTEVAQGQVEQIRYVPHATTPLDTGADATMTGEASEVGIFTKSNIGTSAFTLAPRQATHDTAGVAALFAAGGAAVNEKVVVGQERIKLVVAQGGNVKAGTFYVYVS